LKCGDTSRAGPRPPGPRVREGIDFLPLTCPTYEERPLPPAGRNPASFSAAKAAPPSAAILTTRLIDRPNCGPLFPSWLRDDIQVVANACRWMNGSRPDVLAVTGASIAPPCWPKSPSNGPMAPVRVGLLGDDFSDSQPQLTAEIERSGVWIW